MDESRFTCGWCGEPWRAEGGCRLSGRAIAHSRQFRAEPFVGKPLTAETVTGILGTGCPECGWRRGQHKPAGELLGEPCSQRGGADG